MLSATPRLSRLVEAALIASANSPDGSPPPPLPAGAMMFWAVALLAGFLVVYLI